MVKFGEGVSYFNQLFSFPVYNDDQTNKGCRGRACPARAQAG